MHLSIVGYETDTLLSVFLAPQAASNGFHLGLAPPYPARHDAYGCPARPSRHRSATSVSSGPSSVQACSGVLPRNTAAACQRCRPAAAAPSRLATQARSLRRVSHRLWPTVARAHNPPASVGLLARSNGRCRRKYWPSFRTAADRSVPAADRGNTQARTSAQGSCRRASAAVVNAEIARRYPIDRNAAPPARHVSKHLVHWRSMPPRAYAAPAGLHPAIGPIALPSPATDPGALNARRSCDGTLATPRPIPAQSQAREPATAHAPWVCRRGIRVAVRAALCRSRPTIHRTDALGGFRLVVEVGVSAGVRSPPGVLLRARGRRIAVMAELLDRVQRLHAPDDAALASRSPPTAMRLQLSPTIRQSLVGLYPLTAATCALVAFHGRAQHRHEPRRQNRMPRRISRQSAFSAPPGTIEPMVSPAWPAIWSA